MAIESDGEIGQELGQVGAVRSGISRQAGVKQAGQIAAVVHKLPPEAAAFVESVVGCVGTESQQQAEQDAQEREKLLIDRDIQSFETGDARRDGRGVQAHQQHPFQ